MVSWALDFNVILCLDGFDCTVCTKNNGDHDAARNAPQVQRQFLGQCTTAYDVAVRPKDETMSTQHNAIAPGEEV